MNLLAAKTGTERAVWVRLAAWVVVLAMFCNVLAFVLHCSNPVLMSDDWYFLSVFVRKVVDHNLHFGDFFIRRSGADHSEPLIKLVLLWCAQSFDLDISVEAIFGVVVTFAFVLLFRFLVFADGGAKDEWRRNLAWVAIAAVMFSLNGVLIWTWALNSAQYSSFILLPLFLWSVWRAYGRRQYLLLAVITIAMGLVGDDNAVIGVIAALAALTFYVGLGKNRDWAAWGRISAVVLTCMLVIRIGYSHVPVVGGITDISPLEKLRLLGGQIRDGEWTKWISAPLVWAVASRPFLPPGHEGLLRIFGYGVLITMLLLHGWFWVRVVRSEWNLQIFIATCLMLVTYGWLAGVLLYRVPLFGAEYFQQGRYVRLYQFQLVAMVLMWVGAASVTRGDGKKGLLSWCGAAACAAFIVLQMPMSTSAWAQATDVQRYSRDLAQEIYRLASNPSDSQALARCNPQLPICEVSLHEREELLRFIESKQLNVFSPRFLLAHPYLLTATASLDASRREQLLSATQHANNGDSGESKYALVRAWLGLDRTARPKSGADVNAMRPGYVPLLFNGCWHRDGEKHHASSWCGPDVTLVLRQPAERSNLVIQGWLPLSIYEKAGKVPPVTITVAMNDVEVARKVIDSDGSFVVDVPAQDLPDSAPNTGLAFIRISGDQSFVPSQFGLSQDARELSMKLQSVNFVPAGVPN